MRVIAKRLSMETTQDKTTLKRRSFFIRIFGGIAGGWIAGNLFSHIVRTTTVAGNKEIVQVKINPLAVRRTKKETTSHGA
jgi:hypothetical protein